MTRQLSLFDDGEATGTTVVRIATSDDAPVLTKSQKSFNTLITRIESLRDSLARWQAFLPELQRRLTQELLPLQERIDAQRSAGLHALDAAYRDPRLTKRERGKVQALIVTGTRDLLTRIDDAGLVALHDRHSDVGHDDARRDEAEFLKAMAADMFGVDLDATASAQTPDEVLDSVTRELEERAGAVDAERAEPPPRRSAKAQAKWLREQAQAREATGAVRDVYRKLASALHPDRETDIGERTRKTALMQRVNQAYEKRDLLRLLELQIETEQIDRARLGEVGERRLKHYISILKEQVRELEQELDELIAPFAMNMPYRRGVALQPADVLSSVQAEQAQLRQEKAFVEGELELFRDVPSLKLWLKGVRLSDVRVDHGFDAIESMLGGEPAARRRGRGRQR